ncbi:putative T7SS-secreted protein [Streptomyces griseus]|uniref:putative T7SS-secreted protein n=1 Tax=Streptomyces griseus TaxID=1911 RepID=UPI003426DE33
MVDWRGGLDKVVDGTVRGLDKGKELLGQGVDAATDKVGAGLDKVGAHDWADKVEDWGDETASTLGAEVGEQQLGQSEEADELIHGRPEKITATIKNLRDFQKAFDLVGGGMKKLDAAHWRGEAADTFRDKFQTLPTDWLRAADAFEDAAKALETYSSTVTSAQGKAREALALYKEGKQDSEKAVSAYNKKVDAYNTARTTDQPLPHPGTFSDPGVAKQKRAQEVLEDARRARNEAAEQAKSAVTAAMAHAPKEPTGTNLLKNELYDHGMAQGVELAHLGGGILKGTGGLVSFLRQTNPIDPYNLTHPAEMYKGVNMTLSGLTRTVANPDRALEGAWDAFKGDPTEFVGRMLPEALGTKGAGTLKGGLRAGLRRGMEPEKPPKPPGPAREGHEKAPDSNGKQCKTVKCAGDPIDVATGRMLMPQTDIALPGALPLVFSRVFDSSYRSGRWFGAGWSSTVDQRLEIDAQGVVFTCDQGSLLAYPHPAPGVPVMPTHGRQWPLDRVADGYTITDPQTGQVLHFADQNPDLALLAQIDDRNGRWIAFEYDERGAPTSIVHHGGYHLKLTTSGERVTALHLADAGPNGTDQEILGYGYADGHLATVTNSSGKPLRFDCDALGRITAWTDTNGSRYEYVYDDLDRCVYQSGTDGHLEARFTWDDTDPETGLRMTSMTDGLGHTKRYVINERTQVVAEIDALGAVNRFEYDSRHRLLSVTDPLGRVSRSTYDRQGRLVSVVRPDGLETTADYNDLGLPIRITNPDRTVVRQEYDDRGNRITVTDPSGAVTRTTYNAEGYPTSVTDSLGNTTHTLSDSAGLPSKVTNPLGATTRVERDAFGRPVALTDPLGALTRLEWTPEGKLARRTDADGSTQSWTYDGEGNCLTHTDAMGSVSHFEYTHFDLMSARTGPDGVRYEFTHDHELRLTQVLNPQKLTWDYSYDPVGRLISESDFDNRTLSYARDSAGRLTTRTDALGQTTRYEHDELDRIVRKDAAGAVTTFTYDLTGQLAEAVNTDATVTWLRDQYGRLRSETVNGRTMSYTYDELGRRTSRTTPGGVVSTWTYDPAGRRASLTTSGRTLTFEHDAAGQEVARHLAHHVTIASQFDTMGRLTTQEVKSADRISRRRDYHYRADGHLTGLADKLSGTRTFDLDTSGRVIAVHSSNWTENYAYDAAGNQAEASWPAAHPGQEAVGTRSYTGTTITLAGNVRYDHDALGRITLRQRAHPSRTPDTWRYEWDTEDRMRSAWTPDGSVWRYRYDALGRRISKQRQATDGGPVEEEVSFTWDGGTLCEQLIDAQTSPHRIRLTWNHCGLRPITQAEQIISQTSQEAIDERFLSIITDSSGAALDLFDESGESSWKTRNTLWGVTAWSKDSKAYTPLRFPGQQFDPETGLNYNLHRYYEPETSRYLTPDPLGLDPSPNPTTYVSNPYREIDPFGLSAYKVLYHGTHEWKGEEFSLDSHINEKRQYTPNAGIYLTDDFERAATQYAGPGGTIVRVEVPAEKAASWLRLHEGPAGNLPEYFVNNFDDLELLNKKLTSLPQREAIVQHFMGIF